MRILFTIVAVLFSLVGLMVGSLGLFALPLVLISIWWFLEWIDATDDALNCKGKR